MSKIFIDRSGNIHNLGADNYGKTETGISIYTFRDLVLGNSCLGVQDLATIPDVFSASVLRFNHFHDRLVRDSVDSEKT